MLVLRRTWSNGHRTVIAHVRNLDEARAMLPGQVLAFEEDADHPGCYDVAVACGRMEIRLYTLEQDGAR